ncbi:MULTISPECIES: flagellar motor protein [unclassified Motilimonas]|uniref:flagellar motor protein n=1 Tax=Motilimonas TaxID=1914248 RepID=UPI001E4B9510|nr:MULTISPECIES: flagellar motor protein [unclassified Motilimonas]MCE0556258.1 flagellar motor protein [Motilimonas sp. E26]MDO6524998.1 flagellar motor protein [Motilimonas sp. 1_MG-2023]
MDILGLFGLFLAFASLIVAESFTGGNLSFLLNLAAFVIVVGGTLGAVLFQSTADQFRHAVMMLPQLVNPPVYPVKRQITHLKQWSSIARAQGFLALESTIEDKNIDPFTQKGLSMIVDGIDAVTLRSVLEQEVDLKQEYYERSAKVYEAMGGYSPTVGIIGAVMGLIQAMSHIDDPSVLGRGIAAAFVATIYGVGFANFIFLPICHKLRALNYKQALYHEMTIEGLVSIVNGENALVIERRLESFSVESH